MPELFANFEVNRDPRWKIILVLLCSSVVFHLVILASVAYVPTLREALNIAAMVGRSNYVERPYARTGFGENIQMVQLAPKFQYPPGYFAIGTPAAMAAAAATPTPNPNDPRIVSQAAPPARLAPQSPSPTPSPSPVMANAQSTGTPSSSPGPTGQASGKVASETAKDKTSADQEKDDAQKQLNQVAAANNIDLPDETEINKQPLKDLAAQANDLNSKGKLDLNKPFEVVIEAELDSTGRMRNPTVTQKSGDGSLAGLATDAIGAINDSNLLIYLKKLNGDKPTKITVRVSQDQNSVVAKFESEVESEESARQKAGGFNLLLAAGESNRKGKDEAVLMSHTSASAEGKKLIFTFKMPTQAIGEMLKKQMAANSTTKG